MNFIEEFSSYSDFYNGLSTQEKKLAPKELFHEGDLPLLFHGPKISVVGSRKVSELGLRRTAMVTELLVKHDITVVSGLAAGVDTMAHNTAINEGGKTIAVLGTPLNQVTPKANESLLNEIKRNHLAISQFPKGSRTYPSNFPKRNLLMALISDATIIIEASENSGTQHQAWEAIRLGRDLFLLENVVQHNYDWVTKVLDYGAMVLNRKNAEQVLQSIAENQYC